MSETFAKTFLHVFFPTFLGFICEAITAKSHKKLFDHQSIVSGLLWSPIFSSPRRKIQIYDDLKLKKKEKKEKEGGSSASTV